MVAWLFKVESLVISFPDVFGMLIDPPFHEGSGKLINVSLVVLEVDEIVLSSFVLFDPLFLRPYVLDILDELCHVSVFVPVDLTCLGQVMLGSGSDIGVELFWDYFDVFC